MTSCGLPLEAPLRRPLRRWAVGVGAGAGPGLDLTGLALLRILTAGWLLVDLAQRAAALTLLVSDSGAYSRTTWLADLADLAQAGQSWGSWSFHLLTGATELQAVLLVVAAIAHLALLVGWNTRLSALVSAFLLVSLANRMPLAALPLDPLLALLTWWCAVLPCAARLSLDAARRGPGGPPPRLGGILAVGFVLSLAALTFLLAQVSPSLALWPLLVLLVTVIPHAWWRRVPAAWPRPPVTIWIDGECGICTRAGRLLTQIHGGRLSLRLIQEDPEILALSQAHTSWVVEADGRRFLGWKGVRTVLGRSPWLWPGAMPLPWLGEKIYAFIATHRHRPWWGWLGPIAAEEPLPVILRWSLVGAFAACLAWQPAARASGLRVIPAARLEASLVTAPATAGDGRRIDLRSGGDVALVEPVTELPPVYARFSSVRTQAHIARLQCRPVAARAYLDYLVRLAAARGAPATHAELRQLTREAAGWRSQPIATTP